MTERSKVVLSSRIVFVLAGSSPACSTLPYGPEVRIAAFHAVDPGSIPGTGKSLSAQWCRWLSRLTLNQLTRVQFSAELLFLPRHLGPNKVTISFHTASTASTASTATTAITAVPSPIHNVTGDRAEHADHGGRADREGGD